MVSLANVRTGAFKLLSALACVAAFCAVAAASYFLIGGHSRPSLAALTDPLTTGSVAVPLPPPTPVAVVEPAPPTPVEPRPAALADLDSAGLARLIGGPPPASPPPKPARR